MIILGSYVFIETSSPQTVGDKASLLSEMFPATKGRCIEFWYHMKGADIGTLTVSAVNQNGSAYPIWSLSGEQGSKWMNGQAPIVQSASYHVSGA